MTLIVVKWVPLHVLSTEPRAAVGCGGNRSLPLPPLQGTTTLNLRDLYLGKENDEQVHAFIEESQQVLSLCGTEPVCQRRRCNQGWWQIQPCVEEVRPRMATTQRERAPLDTRASERKDIPELCTRFSMNKSYQIRKYLCVIMCQHQPKQWYKLLYKWCVCGKSCSVYNKRAISCIGNFSLFQVCKE